MKRKESATVLVLILVLLLSATLIACNGEVDITLSFIVDGEVYHTIDTKGDGLITLPTNPTKEDYVFDGWFWEDGRPFTVNSLKDTPISEDLSVYAKWHSVEDEENDITITFTVIGGGAVPSQTIGYDGLINRPENPVRAGHILVGWFTDADCTTRWDFANGKVRTDIILYAKWVSETDMNSVEIVKAEGITVGSDTLKTTVPAAQDKYKVFDNLEANPYATIEVYRDDQGAQKIGLGVIDLVPGDNIAYVMITSGTGTVKKLYTLTIHRNFMFDVTFNYNNDSSADTIQVEEGDLVPSREAESKTGYTFDKWQYNGSAWAFDTAKVTGNMTLDAKWNANKYPVSFFIWDETEEEYIEEANIEVPYGQQIIIPELLREGYSINNWYTDQEKTLEWNFNNPMPGDTVILYGNWTINQYTISFNSNGGSEVTAITQDYGTEVDKPAEPTKEGYTFDGWYTDNDTFVNEYIFSTIAADDTILYANWTINQYTISFNSNGGSAVVAITQDYGTEVSVPTAPTRDYYTFNGWYTDDGTFSNAYTFTTMPADNITVFAKWTINQYTISFNSNGGSEVTAITQDYGTEVDEPAEPTKEGYTFDGWYTDNDTFVNEYIFSTIAADDTILYANWTINQYTISFNSNGGSAVVAITQDYGTEVSVPTAPTRDYYTFNGWYTDDGTFSNAYTFTTMPADNITVFAKWTINQYTISFNSNGGSEVTAITQDYGTEVDEPAEPTKEGYTFDGWYTDNDTFVNEYIFSTIAADDTILYANWTINQYTISFNSNGGSAVVAITQDYGTEVSVPTAPTRDYYTFNGWYTDDGTFSNAYTFTTMPADNITVFAKWTINQYTISFNSNGGSEVTAITQDYGTEVDEPAEPTKEGYTFDGWYTDNDTFVNEYIFSTIAADDTILYANWTINQYTISFNSNGGSAVVAITQDYGTEVSVPTAPTRDYYTFNGWYTDDGTFSNAYTFTTMPADNITVFAKWTINQYTISFNSNGGSTVSATSLYYGDRLDLNEYTTTRSGYSFIGWYLDINDSEAYEATTMPDHNLSLKAKWIVYNLNEFKYNIEKLAISEFDTINAALFNAELFDSDGELVEIEATLNGTQEAGQTVSIRLLASGKYDKIKQVTINNIKVYGMPSISYDTEKDYFNLSDTLNSALFGLSGKDTYDVDTITAVSVQQESYAAGDLVTIILTSTDPAGGNVTTIEIANVKVYGEPDISYTETKTDIKASDTVGNELWNVSALDSFGETLSATTEIISGSQAAGNTITVRISSTDSKGNTRNITFDVRVYGTPTIGTATKTDFKVSDDITVESLGIGATDSHNGTVEDVSIIVKSGTQTSGTYMIYTVTAVDLVGNIATKDITVKIFDLPVFAPQTKTGIKTNDDLSLLSSFAVTAKDSFNAPLTVAHTLKSGSQTGGTVMVYTFTATDAANNIASVEYSYQVYAQSDITITYQAGASDLVKLTSQGEEFFVTATDSFGEPCTIKLLKADGTVATSGTTINIIFRATDAAGNYKDTPVISNIKIYGTPIATYTYDYYYLKQDDNIEFMLTVSDSFNSELYADVTQISYESGIRTVSVTATDDAGNLFERTYELYQLAANQSYLALYSGTEFLGYHIVTQGEDYNLPVDFIGYNNIIGWQLDNQYITNSDGNSLSVWNKPSNGYRVQLISSLITYNISYSLDGGVNNIDNPSTYTVESLGGADGFITLQAPTKVTNTTNSSVPIGDGRYENTVEITAYTFLGWHTDAAFSNEVSVITIALGSVTLYAKWTTTTTTTTTVSAYQRINASGVPTANGNYILFGEYPQTIKANEVTVGTSADTRGYYLGSDGYYYAKVTATPKSSGYTFSTSATVSSGTVYYFKVEPIKWRILSEENGTALILCESIIANKRYAANSNNYMNSEIRAWLNNEFYNTAFNTMQQELIQITEVDNSVYSTGYSRNSYACANTNDKIFLPSYREMVNTAYGFSSNSSDYDTARRRLTSDYSRATGAYMNTDTSYYGNGAWRLRSPINITSRHARYVNFHGHISYDYDVSATHYGVNDAYFGVVPALKIRLSTPQPIEYTISFNSNGGSNVQAITKEAGESINEPTAPTNTGYTFDGWYTDNNTFINEYEFTTMPEESFTLYAKWIWDGQNDFDTNGYYLVDNYIWFGEYPQTIKANDVTITETIDGRGYYLGSDGYYYAKITATPYSSGYTFSTSATVSSGTVYYFKVEPIKWRILTESGGTALILCESIIANKRYAASSNNYMNSEIRAWLNDEFYNKAFTALQQELIQITNVDNSVYSTGYSSNPHTCENTTDKIFLPSYREMVNTAYGFSSDYSAYDTARRRLTSDYSRATGVWMSTDTTYYGNGYWWLRSPDYFYSSGARYVYLDGCVYDGYRFDVNSDYCGLVPALKIRLS